MNLKKVAMTCKEAVETGAVIPNKISCILFRHAKLNFMKKQA